MEKRFKGLLVMLMRSVSSLIRSCSFAAAAAAAAGGGHADEAAGEVRGGGGRGG